MKASEVIAKLEDLIAKYGDLDTLYNSDDGLADAEKIEIYETLYVENQSVFVIT
jgi:hypothetical protein